MSDRTCSITDCDRRIVGRGLCRRHYSNWYRYGTPIPLRDIPPHERLDIIGWDVTDSGCWEWRGTKRNGYAILTCRRFGVVNALVHRLMYERYFGPIPEGLLVRHRCDNPPCVNPAHLEVGTNQQNMDDKVARGRTRNQYVEAACCVRGHEFTPENTYIRKNGSRACRACRPLRA